MTRLLTIAGLLASALPATAGWNTVFTATCCDRPRVAQRQSARCDTCAPAPAPVVAQSPCDTCTPRTSAKVEYERTCYTVPRHRDAAGTLHRGSRHPGEELLLGAGDVLQLPQLLRRMLERVPADPNPPHQLRPQGRVQHGDEGGRADADGSRPGRTPGVRIPPRDHLLRPGHENLRPADARRRRGPPRRTATPAKRLPGRPHRPSGRAQHAGRHLEPQGRPAADAGSIELPPERPDHLAHPATPMASWQAKW